LQLSAKYIPDGEVTKKADVNQDGKIDLAEAVFALQTGAGLRDCGAFVAPGVWKKFDCFNLGAIGKATNDNPFTPSWMLIGGYWQWGRKGPDPDQEDWYDTNTEHFAHGPTGPGAGDANSSVISEWDSSYAQDGAWSDSAKTANDPCPDGYRIPTIDEWKKVLANNEKVFVGSSWESSAANYDTGVKIGDSLFLPAAGDRYDSSGVLANRGQGSRYWSSSEFGSYNAWNLNFTSGDLGTDLSRRRYGYSIRCIAE